MNIQTAIKNILTIVGNSELKNVNYTTGEVIQALHSFEQEQQMSGERNAIIELFDCIHFILREDGKAI